MWKHWRLNDVKVPIHKETISGQVCTHISLQVGLEVSLKSVISHSRAVFFRYTHIVHLTWDSQKKSNDSAFIKLSEEEIDLIDQTNLVHKSLVKSHHISFIQKVCKLHSFYYCIFVSTCTNFLVFLQVCYRYYF